MRGGIVGTWGLAIAIVGCGGDDGDNATTFGTTGVATGTATTAADGASDSLGGDDFQIGTTAP